MATRIKPDRTFDFTGLASLLICLAGIAAYVTHLCWAIKMFWTAPLGSVTPGELFLMTFGSTLFFPVGVLHGIWLWFH